MGEHHHHSVALLDNLRQEMPFWRKVRLVLANNLLDHTQRYSDYSAFIEGNHCWRIDRWAAKTAEGKGAYSLLSPRLNLSRGRKNWTYIKYGSANGRLPHYKLNKRVVAVHGWSYAKNVAAVHLAMSQGRSVLFGHCHRIQTSVVQGVWDDTGTVQARSGGCLCNRVPIYGTGNPVEWTNGFILGYLGTHSDTMYTVTINGNSCVLPSGKEVRV